MLKLVYFPDPILLKPSEPCSLEWVEAEAKKPVPLWVEMHKAMKEWGGVGLAAPQVGINKRLFVLDVGTGMEVYMNPVILNVIGLETPILEGCLSFPGVYEKVKRAPGVAVLYIDVEGVLKTISAYKLRAQGIMHETEHLDGIVLPDHLNSFKRKAITASMESFNKGNHGQVYSV